MNGVYLEGYEIHMGVTTLKEGAKPFTKIKDFVSDSKEKADGAYKDNVYGTYVHSCFDKEGAAKAVVTAIAKHKGLDASKIKGVDYQEFKETQYDILADTLRKYMDMDKIYKIMEEGV